MKVAPPTLWVFDASALPDVDTRQIKELPQVFPVLDQLNLQAADAPRPSVRLKRLVALLGRRFPGGNAVDQGSEALVWENDVTPLPRSVRSAIWAVPLAPEARLHLLSDLVTWARELMLDVYDDELGIYVPADGLPVPFDRAVKFMRAFFRKEARRPWENALALRQAVIHGLTLMLTPAGFAFTPRDGDDACFTRTVPDGIQRVTALVTGVHPGWRCRFIVEHHSHAIRHGMTVMDGELTPGLQDAYKSFALLGRQLDLLRVDRNPDWHDDLMGWPWLTFCMTPFWLDWMLEDLSDIGLKLLDDMSTAEGLLNVLTRPDYQWYAGNLNNEGLANKLDRKLVSAGAVHLSLGQLHACRDLMHKHEAALSAMHNDPSGDADAVMRMVKFRQGQHA
jgi:hypothetical protein